MPPANTATTAPTNTAPSRFKEGDRVTIVARDASATDTKSGLYFPHFANLRGKILKSYGEEASVLVDRESLPGDVRVRHEQVEVAERTKYLDRLSEEARNRLGQKEKEFGLTYAILVSQNDLRPDTGAPTTAPAPVTARGVEEAKAVAHAMQTIDPVTGESTVGEASPTAEEPDQSGTDSAAKRLTEGELEAKEEAYLAERQSKAKKK